MTLFDVPGSIDSDALTAAAFNEWYSTYPRKRCRKDAYKAYRSALKVNTPAQLVQARDALIAEGREEKYVPYPSTFLRRHLDDYLEVPVKRERPAPVCPKHGSDQGCRFYNGSGWVCPT